MNKTYFPQRPKDLLFRIVELLRALHALAVGYLGVWALSRQISRARQGEACPGSGVKLDPSRLKIGEPNTLFFLGGDRL